MFEFIHALSGTQRSQYFSNIQTLLPWIIQFAQCLNDGLLNETLKQAAYDLGTHTTTIYFHLRNISLLVDMCTKIHATPLMKQLTEQSDHIQTSLCEVVQKAQPQVLSTPHFFSALDSQGVTGATYSDRLTQLGRCFKYKTSSFF